MTTEKKFLTGIHKTRYPEFDNVLNLICAECGYPMKYEFVNDSNIDDNGVVMECTGPEHHTGWVTYPISNATFAFRFIRGQFENRHNSLRNRFLEKLRICTCTNGNAHGHRNGIHGFVDKKGNCPICDRHMNPNNPSYLIELENEEN